MQLYAAYVYFCAGSLHIAVVHGDIICFHGCAVLRHNAERLLNACNKSYRQRGGNKLCAFGKGYGRSDVVKRHAIGHGHGYGILRAFGNFALLAFYREGGDGSIGRKLAGEIEPVAVKIVRMALAAPFKEAKVPHAGVAAFIGGHGVVHNAGGMVEIAGLLIGEGLHPVLYGALALTIGEARVGMAVYAHAAQRHYRPGGRFAVHRAPCLERIVVGVHLVDYYAKALVQLSRYATAEFRIVLIGRNGVHYRRHHVRIKAIGKVNVVQQRFQQRRARPFGVFGNGVIAHVQRHQRERGAVYGIAAAVVVQHRNKVVHRVALAVGKGLAAVVLGKVAAIEPAGGKGHHLAVYVGHGNVCGGIERPYYGRYAEAVRRVFSNVAVKA